MNRKEKVAEFLQEGYQINVTGRNVLVTDAMRDYVFDKISKIEKFSTNRIINVNVILEVQRAQHRADIILKVNNLRFFSQADSTDMYASIDKAVEKIEAQLLRYKRKIKEHQTKDLATVDMNVNVVRPHRQDDLLDVNDAIEDENQRELVDNFLPHSIVAQESIPLKTLTYDEAIVKMETSSDVFLVFRAEDDQKVKIIYRRKDGNYGVIEPEA